jgi:hypothetical protein
MRTHLEWRIALSGGRPQAMKMLLAGRRVRRILGQNFDSLLAHVQSTAPGV